MLKQTSCTFFILFGCRCMLFFCHSCFQVYVYYYGWLSMCFCVFLLTVSFHNFFYLYFYFFCFFTFFLQFYVIVFLYSMTQKHIHTYTNTYTMTHTQSHKRTQKMKHTFTHTHSKTIFRWLVFFDCVSVCSYVLCLCVYVMVYV